jgi:hypothetical protein
LRLNTAGLTSGLAARFLPFAPALAASVILMTAGWKQIRSPGEVVDIWPGPITICGLFALTMVLGVIPGVRLQLGLIAAWTGLCGIVVVGGLFLVRKRIMPGREVRERRLSCST